MGLDQYLKGIKHLSVCEKPAIGELQPELSAAASDLLKDFKLTKDDIDFPYSIINVAFPAFYWRKANQIHAWFESEVADNKFDNGGTYFVNKDTLSKLLDSIQEALDSKDGTILKPKSGFFWGSTEIDEWYWEELKDTLRLRERLDKFDYFEYSANW